MTQNIFSKFLPEYKLTIFDESNWQNPQQKLTNQDIVNTICTNISNSRDYQKNYTLPFQKVLY